MKKYFFLLLPAMFFISAGCTKSNMPDDQPESHIKLGEGYAAGAAVRLEIFSLTALSTGYNPILIKLYDSLSGQPVENAAIRFRPMMDMGTMKHSAPVENPAPTALKKQFSGAVVFTMPSGSMGTWALDILVEQKGKHGLFSMPVQIAEPKVSRLKSFVSKVDNSKFFIALLEPAQPKIGVNDMELAIYRVKNMMEFPADSSLTVTLSPEMPTMGHGSPNNTDPVHTVNGHYKGKVNFTMTGLWHLNLGFYSESAVADDNTFFEVNF